MTTFNSELYSSQSYSKISDRPEVLDAVQFVDAAYVISGSEVAGDIIKIAKLDGNVKLIPQLTTIYCDDPGTALTVALGTGTSGASTGSLDTGIDVKAGGAFTAGDGTAGTEWVSPSVLTSPVDLTATVVTASGLTAGADVVFRAAYQAKN